MFPNGPCIPDSTSACVLGSQYRFGVNFKNPNTGTPGFGQAVSPTPDTGYVTFFSANNAEQFVKVVDGSAFDGRIWVGGGALTNVPRTMMQTHSFLGRWAPSRNQEWRT